VDRRREGKVVSSRFRGIREIGGGRRLVDRVSRVCPKGLWEVKGEAKGEGGTGTGTGVENEIGAETGTERGELEEVWVIEERAVGGILVRGNLNQF